MSYLAYFLLFCAIFSSAACSKRHKNGGRIVGGSNTNITDYPYQAYLLLYKPGSGYYQCGGSIISDRVILTAAHCLTGISRAYITIGSTESGGRPSNYTSSFFLFRVHPEYNIRPNNYDCAVIRTSKPMALDGTYARTVTLADEGDEVPAGSELVVTGWGATSEGGDTSSTLMEVKVPVISNEECSQSLSGITDQMMCAGLEEGGKDSCQGDSGGPAVTTSDGVQVGIVSFGVGCARPGYPGVYARVSSCRSWIKQVARV